MKHGMAFVVGVVMAMGSCQAGATGQDHSLGVRDTRGQTIGFAGSQGRSREFLGPLSVSTPVAGLAESRLVTVEGPLGPECALTPNDALRVDRESRVGDQVLDACGRRSVTQKSGQRWIGDANLAPDTGRGSSTQATIDRMTTRLIYGSYLPGDAIILMGSAETYDISDGSQWSSGAGSYYNHGARLRRVFSSGSTIHYVLSPGESGLIYQQTDYDSGEHSAQGALGAPSDLVIEAQLGATTAVMRGQAIVVSNDITWYGESRFNFYSAIVGSVVPFEIVFSLMNGQTWAPDTFDHEFSYSSSGWVDFANPVSTPAAVELSISGSGTIPDETSTTFSARVRYENGVVRDVSTLANWSVEPPSVASVEGGVVSVGPLSGAEQDLLLRAAYVDGSTSLTAEKQVRCIADLAAEGPGVWPMFQADARHSGYLPVRLDPAQFTVRWQRDIGGEFALNPVAAGDGKVFVSLRTYFGSTTNLFALNALGGETIWSKGFGSVFSVNPPSYAYGNVYIQTGNHSSDTWLHAFDGDTGDVLFKAPHSAQWERYFAPTIHDYKIYINGGYYGGMYGFDAFSGEQLWFADLPQYDEWTPAVVGDRAYAYVGDYTPGLYVEDRFTGIQTQFVADPNFSWNGWSMRMAPVVGDHDDVIVIHDGRLLSFDTLQGNIRWEVQSQFSGQPSVVAGQIFAVDGSRLVVLDELTHAELWSWQSPGSGLTGQMVVTDGHVLVSTDGSVHAIDLLTHQSVWSYPVSGNLALADNTLYVASEDGMLTAFSAPRDLIFKNGFE